MISLLDVSYVRLGTRDLEGATRFAVDYLGLEVSRHGKGSVCFKSDVREHTLCYFEGDPADQAVAFEVRDKDDLDAAASELSGLGTLSGAAPRARPRPGTSAALLLSRTRAVTALSWSTGPRDPAGATMAAATPASRDSVTSAFAHPM